MEQSLLENERNKSTNKVDDKEHRRNGQDCLRDSAFPRITKLRQYGNNNEVTVKELTRSSIR